MTAIANTSSLFHVHLMLFCIVILTEANLGSVCSGNGTRFVDGTCYRLFTGPSTWFDAKRHCETQGTVLASFETLDQIKRILINLDIRAEVWIGATDLAIEGHYVWIQNNQLANDDLAKLWDSREPNNEVQYNGGEDEDCISIYKNLYLNDAPCSFRHSYSIVCTFAPYVRNHGYSEQVHHESSATYSLLKHCPDGKFGYKCKYPCQCPNNETCDKITGLCNGGKCKGGHWGPGCQLDDKCYYNNQTKQYMGMQNLTVKRIPCQQWSRKYPHRQAYTKKHFPDRRLPNNYCRATTDSDQAWCYTTSSRYRWQICSLGSCECPRGRYGIYCSKDCHCKGTDEHCNEVTGECTTDCANGWSGKDCQTVIPCEPNFYGWECENKCHCENPSHCQRFMGPTSQCVCKKELSDQYPCRQWNNPAIVYLGNNKVSPGQASVFTCTVHSTLPPKDNEIQLFGPQGKNITSIAARIIESSASTRTQTFFVNGVKENEQYTCLVRTAAGTDSLTVVADVFSFPECPNDIFISNVNNNHVTISWKTKKLKDQNQKFQVMMYNVTNNSTNTEASHGFVLGEVENTDTETLTYNINGLTNMNDHVFTLVTSNDYGKVECKNTRTAFVTADVKIIVLSSQNIAIITICPTLLVVIIVGFIIYKKGGKSKQQIERPHTYDALMRNRNDVISNEISTNDYNLVQGVTTPAYLKLTDCNNEHHYDYVDYDKSTNHHELCETEGL